MSKKYIFEINKANPDSAYSFGAIKSGEKWVETRAATDKYKKIVAGDVMVLVCGSERLEKKVIRATVFKDIKSMLKKYKITDIMPNKRSLAELELAYYSYPNYKEKIKKFGLIAFEI